MCEQYKVIWTKRDRDQDGEAVGEVEIFLPDGVTHVPSESPMALPADMGLVTEGEAALAADVRGATLTTR